MANFAVFCVFESISGKAGEIFSFYCSRSVNNMVLTFASGYHSSKVSKRTCPTVWGIQYDLKREQCVALMYHQGVVGGGAGGAFAPPIF